MIPAGRSTNTSRAAAVKMRSEYSPVPSVSTSNATGSAFPIAYEMPTSHSAASPASTIV